MALTRHDTTRHGNNIGSTNQQASIKESSERLSNDFKHLSYSITQLKKIQKKEI